MPGRERYSSVLFDGRLYRGAFAERNEGKAIGDLADGRVYLIDLVRLGPPGVVAAQTHHAAVDKEVDECFGFGVAIVALTGILGALAAVVAGIAAVERLEGMVRGVELDNRVGHDEQFAPVAREGQPAHIGAVVVLLRPHIGLVEVGNIGLIAAHEAAGAAVDVVLPRASSVVFEAGE